LIVKFEVYEISKFSSSFILNNFHIDLIVKPEV